MRRSPKRTPEGPRGNRSRHRSACQHPLQLAFLERRGQFIAGAILVVSWQQGIIISEVQGDSFSSALRGVWIREPTEFWLMAQDSTKKSSIHQFSQGRAPKALAPGCYSASGKTSVGQSDLQQSASIKLYIKDKYVSNTMGSFHKGPDGDIQIFKAMCLLQLPNQVLQLPVMVWKQLRVICG